MFALQTVEFSWVISVICNGSKTVDCCWLTHINRPIGSVYLDNSC